MKNVQRLDGSGSIFIQDYRLKIESSPTREGACSQDFEQSELCDLEFTLTLNGNE